MSKKLVSKGRIKIMRAKNGEDYFVVQAANNRVLMTSETYKTEQSLRKAVDAMRLVMSKGNLCYDKKHPKHKDNRKK